MQSETVHVYDRVRDPHEQQNLAPDRVPPEAAVLLAALRERMDAASGKRAAPGAPLSPEVAEGLRALGYADPEAEPPPQPEP